jgi:hypothetical protein
LTGIFVAEGLTGLSVAVAVHQVLDSCVIAAAEGGSILVAVGPRDGWVFEFVPIVYVGLAVVLEVLASAFDAVVITTLSDLMELGRRRLPGFVRGWALCQDRDGSTD